MVWKGHSSDPILYCTCFILQWMSTQGKIQQRIRSRGFVAHSIFILRNGLLLMHIQSFWYFHYDYYGCCVNNQFVFYYICHLHVLTSTFLGEKGPRDQLHHYQIKRDNSHGRWLEARFSIYLPNPSAYGSRVWWLQSKIWDWNHPSV